MSDSANEEKSIKQTIQECFKIITPKKEFYLFGDEVKSDYEIIDISTEDKSSYYNNSINEYEKSFIDAQNDKSSVTQIYYNFVFLFNLISIMINFIKKVIEDNSNQAKTIIYLQKRINRLIENHNISCEKNTSAIKDVNEFFKKKDSKDFELFFETYIRKDPEATGITFVKVYKMYSSWYANLSNRSCPKMKDKDFKEYLEDKLNVTFTKCVPGIQLFASKEEADDFDNHNTLV